MTRIPLPAGGNKSENLNDRLEMSTAEIGLSVRTTNCLEERGIFTVNDLLNCSPEDLLDISFARSLAIRSQWRLISV